MTTTPHAVRRATGAAAPAAAVGADRTHPRRRREPVASTARAVLYVLYGLPLAWIVLTSLKDQGDVVGGKVLTAPDFGAYTAALSDPALPVALAQSAQIAVGTTGLVLLLGVPLAHALRRIDGRVTSAALALLIFLQMIPQTAGVIPLFTIFSRWGLLDTTAAVVLADTALLLPWAVLLLRPFFAAVPEALEEAAALDGAGPLRAFLQIVLPIVRNGTATVGALIFLVAWGEFLYAINLFLSPVNYPISALIAQQTSGYGIDWPGLMALAVISSLPLLVVYAVSFRSLREGLAVGSVK